VALSVRAAPVAPRRGALPGVPRRAHELTRDSRLARSTARGPDKPRNPYEEAVRPPIPWNFFLIYVGSVMYFMSYSLEVRSWASQQSRRWQADNLPGGDGLAHAAVLQL